MTNRYTHRTHASVSPNKPIESWGLNRLRQSPIASPTSNPTHGKVSFVSALRSNYISTSFLLLLVIVELGHTAIITEISNDVRSNDIRFSETCEVHFRIWWNVLFKLQFQRQFGIIMNPNDTKNTHKPHNHLAFTYQLHKHHKCLRNQQSKHTTRCSYPAGGMEWVIWNGRSYVCKPSTLTRWVSGWKSNTTIKISKPAWYLLWWWAYNSHIVMVGMWVGFDTIPSLLPACLLHDVSLMGGNAAASGVLVGQRVVSQCVHHTMSLRSCSCGWDEGTSN